MLFNFSIKSKILINFVELFDSKTPQRSLHSSFADFILFINYFHLSFFVCVLLLLAIKSVCLSVQNPEKQNPERTKSELNKNSGFCPIRDFLHSGFCTIRDFIHSGVCPIRDFVHSGFCPIRDFVHSGFCFSGFCP